ncbi:hypothetical protein ES703_55565 [subsurface metagenome]
MELLKPADSDEQGLDDLQHGIRKIPEEEAKECVNTLVLYIRQNPDFQKFEGSLLALEEEL